MTTVPWGLTEAEYKKVLATLAGNSLRRVGEYVISRTDGGAFTVVYQTREIVSHHKSESEARAARAQYLEKAVRNDRLRQQVG